MTPREAQKFCIEFAKKIGPRGRVWISLAVDGGLPLTFLLYTNWPMGDVAVKGEAETFESAAVQIEKLWAENVARVDQERIDTLALEIISTTDRKGSCTEADLRMNYRFNSEDIERLGAKACEAANRMAGRGPFSIVKAPGNGAPSDNEELAA
jgi:hypothetical protein